METGNINITAPKGMATSTVKRHAKSGCWDGASGIDISGYTTTAYVCPNDGYVRVTTQGEIVRLCTSSSGTTSFNLLEGNGRTVSAFVRAGAKVTVSGGSSSARYYSIEY